MTIRPLNVRVCPRFNMFNLLLTCDFMAQLQNIAFDKTSFVSLRVVYFHSNSYGILDEFKRLQFGWTNTTIELTNHCHAANEQTVLIVFSNEPLMFCGRTNCSHCV